MKKIVFLFVAALMALNAGAKTLIVYYSFTNNVHTIATDLQAQTGADVLRIEPAEEGLDYAANNYAIGSALISAIRANPTQVSSYPAIKPVSVNLADYDVILVAAPLWWSNMAAPLQSFLFHHGAQMAGKRVGLIVSSASSGISGVESDARRLIPEGRFLSQSLWIRSAQTRDCHALISAWLTQIDYAGLTNAVQPIVAAPATLSVTPGAIRVSGAFDRLSLYDLSGRKRLESTAPTTSTAALSGGMYVAHLSAGDRSFARKICIGK